jgi:HD superfamily phosphohydrolase
MALRAFQEAIEKFAARYLDDYVDWLEHKTSDHHAKEFNDPVWGTILALPHEVAVINSPLFQRLQEIRQLGVAHLIYRSANHTRFEHSLGALHAASVLIREVNNTVKDELRHDEEQDDLDDPITPELETVLRLAALVHDIGHGYMSHVSENAFEDADWVLELAEELDDESMDIPDGVRLSELATYYTVLSKSFLNLLKVLQSRYGIGRPARLQALISKAVLGMTVDEGRPFLSELISGPFDVDKLDYIQRDALMCGVPNVIDTHRLIRKLRTTRTSRQQLPKPIADRINSERDIFVVTGIARSGARTLDEFALARSLLTDKVYRHQKLRAYEALVRSATEILAELSANAIPMMWAFTDSDFVSMSISDLAFSCAVTDVTDTGARKLRLVDSLRSMYRNRSEYVAAYTWSSGQAGEEVLDDDVQIQGVNDLRAEVRRSVERSRVERDIARTMTRMAEQMDLTMPVVESGSDLRYLIRIDPVDEESHHRGRALLSRAFLVGKKGAIVLFSDDFSDAENWSELYLVNREASAIFCPEALAPLAHLASEEVLFSRYGIRVTEAMRQDSHLDFDEVADLRKQLEAAGYFGAKLRPLAPESRVLQQISAKNSIDTIVAKFSRFEGPTPQSRSGAGDITPLLVRQFAQQMSPDNLIAPLLEILTEVKFVGRTQFSEAVRQRLTSEPAIDPSTTVFSVLGDPDESSGAVTYLVKEVLNERGIDVHRIDDVASPEKDTLVLVDDFVGRGGRTQDVFRSWLGKTPGRTPLSESGQEWIKKARVILIFAAGMASARSDVPEILKGLGVNAEVYIHDDVVPRLSEIVPNITRGRAVQQFLESVGSEVLHNSYAQSPRLARSNALGYGNHGLLVAFPYSTPKQTVTALWASGRRSVGPWQALFPRGDRTELNWT